MTTDVDAGEILEAARNPLRWFVFAVVIAANIMDLVDATIVNVAGPSIRAALGGSAPPCSGCPRATRWPSPSS
jgi:hypothetical protein